MVWFVFNITAECCGGDVWAQLQEEGGGAGQLSLQISN